MIMNDEVFTRRIFQSMHVQYWFLGFEELAAKIGCIKQTICEWFG